ncbi:hypothetical protein CHS0354_024116 [Potamilus streckersoni]|uniref:Uncharacterized protein n=1 Tax=Potamilus streckersoni TaxID=2493646 RepID=A0AAE0RZE5_9BIVA|nr:hypothetical protein CHS0354_024116 [Potamilus streckersoni]
MKTFRALVVRESNGIFTKSIEEKSFEELPKHPILVKVKFSSLNFKDALSAHGNKGVTRQYPHTPGIDAIGTVERSTSKIFKEGDEVIVTGYDLGMNTSGGFAEYTAVPEEWVVPKPKSLQANEVAALGTAGLTVGIGVEKLLRNKQSKEGEFVITGSSGGVGTLAIAILSKLKFNITAASSKLDLTHFLTSIGATRVFHVKELLDTTQKPLLKPKWIGGFDTLGGDYLTSILKSTHKEGSVISTGLASSPSLNGTVLPFILNGINLLGVNSADYPKHLKLEIWEKLANDWKPTPFLAQLTATTTTIALTDVATYLDRMIKAECQDISNSKDIISFTFTKTLNPSLNSDIQATITDRIITVELPASVKIATLKPTIWHTGKSITWKSVLAVSQNNQASDFYEKSIYTITAYDNSIKQYTFTATFTDINPDISNYVTVTFKFHPNIKDEEGLTEVVKMKKGDIINKPKDPVISDYLFLGWYKDPALSLPFYFPISITENTTIYAKCGLSVSNIIMAESDVNTFIGKAKQFTATIDPSEAYIKKLMWTSSKPEVATVDSNGLVVPITVGTTTITVMSTDGSHKSTSTKCTVEPYFRIPDKNFRKILENAYSNLLDIVHGDTLLNTNDAGKLKYLDVKKSNIDSLRGIEYFTSLEHLNCNGNKLKNLDLSKNTSLIILNCYNNQLTNLVLSNSPSLTTLNCYNNQLTNLVLSNSPSLTTLNCSENTISSLDIRGIRHSKNTSLEIDSESGSSINNIKVHVSIFTTNPEEDNAVKSALRTIKSNKSGVQIEVYASKSDGTYAPLICDYDPTTDQGTHGNRGCEP